MPVVELVDFKDVNVGDQMLCGTTNQTYGVAKKSENNLILVAPNQTLILFCDSSYILRSVKSGTLYFGIAND
jgi:hypothetical protein